MSPIQKPDVSICIATFRRPRGLARLLDSLSKLKLPDGLDVEIIVVDNDAAGDARAQALAVCELARTVRWFVEPRRNIALARNRALCEAEGGWIAFIDDDEVADEDWLAAHWRSVESDAGDGFFGPVLARFDDIATPWLDVETFFSRPRHATGTPIGAREASTSNALVRRSLFGDRRFDPAWGRTGGSDSELFDRMHSSGARLLWCDEAIVRETIPVRRQSLGWLSQRAFRGGVGYTRLQRERKRSAGSGGSPRALLALALLLPILFLSLLAGRRAAARVWLRVCTQVGHLWASAGQSYEEYRLPKAGAVLD